MHALPVVISLLDHIYQVESSQPFPNIPKPKEKPNIVPMRIDVIFNRQKVLVFVIIGYKSLADISRLKISID